MIYQRITQLTKGQPDNRQKYLRMFNKPQTSLHPLNWTGRLMPLHQNSADHEALRRSILEKMLGQVPKMNGTIPVGCYQTTIW